MEKFKAFFHSERAKTAVNLLFFLALTIHNPVVVFITFVAWVIYLIYLIKTSPNRGTTVINGIFILLAVVMLGINLYSTLQ